MLRVRSLLRPPTPGRNDEPHRGTVPFQSPIISALLPSASPDEKLEDEGLHPPAARNSNTSSVDDPSKYCCDAYDGPLLISYEPVPPRALSDLRVVNDEMLFILGDIWKQLDDPMVSESLNRIL